jgi:hypothetical protein
MFKTITALPDPRTIPLRPGCYRISFPGVDAVWDVAPEALSGAKAGTQCKVPGHYIWCPKWGYLAEGASTEEEAWLWAAANLPKLPVIDGLYRADGQEYRLAGMHPVSKDLLFLHELSKEHTWVTLAVFKDSFKEIP